MNDSDLADLIPSSNSDSMTTLKVPVVTIQNQHRTPKKSSFMPSKPSPLGNPETSLVKKASSPHAVEAQEKMKRLVCANQRTEDEAKVLFNKIQHFPFFETFNDRNSSSFFGDEAFIRLCQTARYEKHAAKKVIFKEGDPTNGKLYIIYSGEVSVVNQPPGGPFITQDPALQTQEDLKDNMSEDNDSSVFTYNGRDDIRFSRFSAERRSTGSFLFTARDSKIKIVDSDGEFCPSPTPAKISRRNTRMISMDILNQMKKQSSEPVTEDGDDSAKLDKRFKNLELRQSVFSNNASRDSLRWNPNNPNSARELKHRMSGIVEPENGSRRGSWKILQHVIPNLAKFKHAVSKKQEAIPLKDVIKQYGNVTNTLGVGEFFGERAVFEQSTRASTIVTNTECEFLVIYKRDFYYVSRNYDRKRTKLLDFIFNFTPDIENIHTFQIAEDLLSILKERTFEKGSHIIEEGKHGNHIVMLFEGSCELVKTLKIDERPDKKDFLAPMQQLVRVRPVYSEELLVCNLDRGAFLGEEVLFTEQKSYSFSGRVTSAFATVFMVSKQDFHMRFTKLTQNHIKNLFFAKRKKHGTLMKYLLQTKYPTLEVCPPPDTSQENCPDYDVKVVSNPIHLRPKDRAEGKRKQRVGLFNALIEQGEDATVLNQYMTTSPAELGHGHGHPKLKRESSLKLAKNAPVEKPKKTPHTVVLELDKGHSETNLDLAPKTLLSQGQKGINRNVNTPSPTFKTRKVTPREMMAAMPPATTRTKLQVRDLKVETSMEHPDHLIDYIKSSQALTLRSVATVGDVAGSKVNLETVRSGDLNVNNGDKNTERMRLKSAGQSRLERRLMSEVEKNDDGPPLDLLSDIFESNKKAKKILEIQKSRISPRIRSVTASSMVDTRLSPMMKTENFYENMKDRYQGKVKNSARLMSARQNTGPFLMINMSPIEPAQSCRSSPKKQIALSAVPSAMTSPITRKTSSKTPYSFTPAAQEITDKDEDLDDKDFRRPIMRDTFTSMLRTERPMTSKSVSNGGAGKIMKALYASTEDVLSKAKTDPSTRILKMKYKRNMKLKMKRQSEKIEIGTNKESVVIDYQVNGALHTYSGQKMFTRTKQQRPMSGVNFGKVVL